MFKRFIVIEGSDGAGKSTQADLLVKLLQEKGYTAKLLEFPNYNSPTGVLIKKMLHGAYGDDASSINPYFTSPMYSMDRYAYFQSLERTDDTEYDFGICSRYTLSNMIHQGAKLVSNEEKSEYWAWLHNYEYDILGIPKPTLCVYLHIPFEVCRANIEKRNAEEGKVIDIHENLAYLEMVENHVKDIMDYGPTYAEPINLKKIDCYDAEKGEMYNKHIILARIISKILEACPELGLRH